MTDYDLETVYDERISPLMTQIIAICKEHGMPMVASFQYARREGDPQFCTTVLIGEDRGFKAHDEVLDRIAHLLRRAPTAYALAETIVTNPDGSKQISIRRAT